MKPRTVCFCQPILSMISVRVAPFLRWSMATTCAVLLPSRTAPAAFFWPLGTPLARLLFVLAFPLEDAPLGDRAPRLALRSAFGFSGCFAFGFSGSPRPWMRFQTRLIAVLWSLNFLTGVTPGRLFQIATSLSAGQALASSASSFWLAKESKGVVVAAAASSGVPCAVMLFSASIVNVILNLLLFRALRGHHMDCSEVLERQGNCSRKSALAKD